MTRLDFTAGADSLVVAGATVEVAESADDVVTSAVEATGAGAVLEGDSTDSSVATFLFAVFFAGAVSLASVDASASVTPSSDVFVVFDDDLVVVDFVAVVLVALAGLASSG
ncbi:MAG: hypothetical protein ACO292_01925, partial [Ilumatobacteraceae bacterium]